jgi:hypothetical protein
VSIKGHCCDALGKAVAERVVGLACERFGAHVNGCCGGCCVLTDIKHCPFCGARLPDKRGQAGQGTKNED